MFVRPRHSTSLARSLHRSALGGVVLLGAAFLAQFGAPRIDFDMTPVSIAVAVLSVLLVVGAIGSMVMLGLRRSRTKRDAMYENQWRDDHVDENPEPFVPDDDLDVSDSVEELFDVDEAQTASQETTEENKQESA